MSPHDYGNRTKYDEVCGTHNSYERGQEPQRKRILETRWHRWENNIKTKQEGVQTIQSQQEMVVSTVIF